jgi:hypothetical protein
MNFRNWIQGSVVLAVIGTGFVLGARAGWYGTSTLSVTPFVPGKTASGIVYFLPRTVVEIEAIYQITKCDVQYNDKDDDYPVSIEASVIAQLNEITEPDFTRGYTIENGSFDGGLWNTDFTVEVSKGSLKSVNAESKSTVAPPKNFDINSLAKIAIEGSGIKPQSTQLSAEAIRKNVEETRKKVCGPAVIDALSNPKETKPGPQDDKPKFSATTMRRVFRVVPGGSCPSGTDPGNPPAAGIQTCIFRGEDSIGKLIGDITGLTSLNKYTIEIRISEAGRVSASVLANATKGLLYRIPGSALVTICLCSGAASATRVLAERTIAVSQFGPEAVIEVERRMFSDRKTHLEFGDVGELKKAAFSDATTAEAK